MKLKEGDYRNPAVIKNHLDNTMGLLQFYFIQMGEGPLFIADIEKYSPGYVVLKACSYPLNQMSIPCRTISEIRALTPEETYTHPWVDCYVQAFPTSHFRLDKD